MEDLLGGVASYWLAVHNVTAAHVRWEEGVAARVSYSVSAHTRSAAHVRSDVTVGGTCSNWDVGVSQLGVTSPSLIHTRSYSGMGRALYPVGHVRTHCPLYRRNPSSHVTHCADEKSSDVAGAQGRDGTSDPMQRVQFPGHWHAKPRS